MCYIWFQTISHARVSLANKKASELQLDLVYKIKRDILRCYWFDASSGRLLSTQSGVYVCRKVDLVVAYDPLILDIRRRHSEESLKRLSPAELLGRDIDG